MVALAVDMKQRKRRTEQASPRATVDQTVVHIGFSPSAHAAFRALSVKERAGLRRKLIDFGLNPAIGKPLVGDLQGYHRVTYGRLRAISKAMPQVVATVTTTVAGIVIVHVLEVGPRKEGSEDDPYERAAIAALNANDVDAHALLEQAVQALRAGHLGGDDHG